MTQMIPRKENSTKFQIQTLTNHIKKRLSNNIRPDNKPNQTIANSTLFQIIRQHYAKINT